MYRLAMMMSPVLILAGCSGGSPGGPGISDVPNVSGVSNTTVTQYRPALGVPDDAFNLAVPTTAIQLQVGAAAKTAVGIKRGKNFQEEVTLSISDLPKGVTVAPEAPMIRHGDAETNIEFHASADAQPGTHRIIILGHPEAGADARSEMTLTITR